jgi:DNA repair exonuclease SbcCD ATPase subunit
VVKGIGLEHRVAEAVVKLVGSGAKPTNRKILALTNGSLSSIQPILKKLKEHSKDFTNLESIYKIYGLKKFNAELLLAENKELQKKLEYLEASNLQLEQQLVNLQADLNSHAQEGSLFKKLYTELKEEREATIDQLKIGQGGQVDLLVAELAAVHKEHSKNYREFSYSKEEQLLQKEIQIIQLKDKLAELQAKLTSYQQTSLPQEKRLQDLKKANLELTTKVFNLEQQLQVQNNG